MNTASTALRAKVSHRVARFAVVSNPGTLFQRIEDYCSTFAGAIEAKGCYDDPCDVMRILPSGELTTEL
jgi:hypothetical protein